MSYTNEALLAKTRNIAEMLLGGSKIVRVTYNDGVNGFKLFEFLSGSEDIRVALAAAAAAAPPLLLAALAAELPPPTQQW